MKVGDLVRPAKYWIRRTGIVLEKGIYTGNRNTRILWDDGGVWSESSEDLEVISGN